ncbi:hypothetical protein HETIRDRAFT_27464, partial [Heterobasidion irregulare TC 32-1]
VDSNEDKAKALATAFFPPPPEHTDIDPGGVYPRLVCKFQPITRDTIRRNADWLSMYKAPGPDRIPNVVLVQCMDTLIEFLFHLYRAFFALDTYFGPWREFTTIVLRKLGKPRYDVPKSYRPIALLNTTAKLLSAIIAKQLTFIGEKHEGVLPPTHFRG